MTEAATLTDLLEPHQLRVVRLSLGLATDAQIAVVMGVGTRTVRYHRDTIRGLLPECETWRQVLRLAIRQGVEPEIIHQYPE